MKNNLLTIHIIFFVIFAVLIGGCGSNEDKVIIDPTNYTKKYIRKRVEEYNSLFKSKNIKSYDYLSAATKENVSIERWEKRLIKKAENFEPPTTKSITIDPSGFQAKVFYGSEGKYSLWVSEDGDWYIAGYEQNPNARAFKPLEEPIKPQFELKNITVGWHDTRETEDIYFYRPQVKFNVKNIGKNAINYLQFLAVFYFDYEQKQVFGKGTAHLISKLDLPLRPEYTSETCIIYSNLGHREAWWEFRGKHGYKTWYVEVFYKTAFGDEWTFLGETNYMK